MLRGLLFAAALAMCACVTTKDNTADDARLDEAEKPDAPAARKKTGCADGAGDLLVLDARTGGPATCLKVTITSEPMSCPLGTDCPSDLLFDGLTSAKGFVQARSAIEGRRLVAVADGFGAGYVLGATTSKEKALEVELPPAEGYWLKVLDGDGNFLSDVLISFTRGDDVVAQLRSNDLANVFFSQRQPFSGEAVQASAEGFQSVTIAAVTDLGDDGHTLTLRK